MSAAAQSSSLNQKLAIELAQSTFKKDTALIQDISSEEKMEFFQLMQKLAHSADNINQSNEQLYIEQELSDRLGFSVASELEGWTLPHSTGKIKSLSHLRRHPLDELSDHLAVRNAQLNPYRSYFGWFTDEGNLYPRSIHREQFYVSVPLQYTPEWINRYTALIEWYRFRKVLVVNPYDGIAVVASIGNVGPHHAIQYQFGGSPELIQTGKIWSINAQGRVLMFFVEDPDDKIALGPITL